jgi:hypothetical protein
MPDIIQRRHRLIQVRAYPPHRAGRRPLLRHRLLEGDPTFASAPWTAVSATSAANAPRVGPDRAIASLTSPNSSSVSENCTTRGREADSLDRRRPRHDHHPVPLLRSLGLEPCPVPIRAAAGGAASIVYLWAAPAQR